ncbi:hypothetical protein STXM2123_2109 [Streptomyces sp. F-3]|nr:hypothetical protein STXM2123_2109 [Streptomyces sp. F-3]
MTAGRTPRTAPLFLFPSLAHRPFGPLLRVTRLVPSASHHLSHLMSS